MMLLVILMGSCARSKATSFEFIEKVGEEYYLEDENVFALMVYIFETRIEDIRRGEGGYFLGAEGIVELSDLVWETQHALSLKGENARLRATNEALENALAEERAFFDRFETKVNEQLDRNERQIEDLTLLYEQTRFGLGDKARLFLLGAAVAAGITLFVQPN